MRGSNGVLPKLYGVGEGDDADAELLTAALVVRGVLHTHVDARYPFTSRFH